MKESNLSTGQFIIASLQNTPQYALIQTMNTLSALQQRQCSYPQSSLFTLSEGSANQWQGKQMYWWLCKHQPMMCWEALHHFNFPWLLCLLNILLVLYKKNSANTEPWIGECPLIQNIWSYEQKNGSPGTDSTFLHQYLSTRSYNLQKACRLSWTAESIREDQRFKHPSV